jgi:hypothetical protein
MDEPSIKDLQGFCVGGSRFINHEDKFRVAMSAMENSLSLREKKSRRFQA